VRSSLLYLHRDSVVHRLHPVTKLVGMVLLFIPAFAFNRPLWLLPLLILLVLLLGVAKVLDNLRRSWWFCLIFFIVSVILWSFFLRDVEPTWKWGPFSASWVSLQYGLAIGLRIVYLLLVGLLFISTTRVEDFAFALRRVGVPEMVLLAFTLAFRLVPTFARSAQAALDAQRARALELERGGIITRLRRYAPLIVPVLASGLRSADDLTRALETKGVGSAGKRTRLKEYPVGWLDPTVLILLAALAGACLWLRLVLSLGELLPRI